MRRVNVDRMRRRLWLGTPGQLTRATYGPRHPKPARETVTYLPPGYELTNRNLDEHGVDLTCYLAP